MRHDAEPKPETISDDNVLGERHLYRAARLVRVLAPLGTPLFAIGLLVAFVAAVLILGVWLEEFHGSLWLVSCVFALGLLLLFSGNQLTHFVFRRQHALAKAAVSEGAWKPVILAGRETVERAVELSEGNIIDSLVTVATLTHFRHPLVNRLKSWILAKSAYPHWRQYVECCEPACEILRRRGLAQYVEVLRLLIDEGNKRRRDGTEDAMLDYERRRAAWDQKVAEWREKNVSGDGYYSDYHISPDAPKAPDGRPEEPKGYAEWKRQRRG